MLPFLITNSDLMSRLVEKWEILLFPIMVGNTGNSRELLVIPRNYWEIGLLKMRKL